VGIGAGVEPRLRVWSVLRGRRLQFYFPPIGACTPCLPTLEADSVAEECFRALRREKSADNLFGGLRG
jgi:hypothetical protein